MARAELLSIGTELLLGQILDTNSQFLSTELANLGIDCMFRHTVGDNTERIIDTFRLALNRADLVISTGGLGPTADDLTHECIAELFKVDMPTDPEVLEHIKGLFKKMGSPMVDSNKKQANRPRGAAILRNPTGTAPGIIWSLSEAELRNAGIEEAQRPRYVLTFPGVPSEMKRMWSDVAKPFLTNLFDQSVLWSQELKHFGIGESKLAEKYLHLLSGSNPTVAPLAGTGECRLRVSAKAASIEEAKQIAAPVIEEILAGSKYLCYGKDNDTLESVLAEMLKKRSMTISAAESCTGGLLSKRLTDIAGSSAYVKLNVVTYANEAKTKMLGVEESLLAQHGAVSPECAEAMATGVRRLAQADIGVSITGIAGPDGGSADKPVGLVYIGIATEKMTVVKKIQLPEQMGREGIRYRTSSHALNYVRLYLLNEDLSTL